MPSSIWDVLNNQSVGAFLGAFAAFFLVVLNDWRRERRKLKTLRAEIEVNLDNARAKLDTARRMRAMIREDNRTTSAPVLRFNTSFTRQLAGEVLHHLSVDERRGIDALCYTMEAIDGLIGEAEQIAHRFSGPMGQAERVAAGSQLQQLWADCVANLKRLIEMCENYLAGRSKELLAKQYNAADYEEA